MAIRRTDTDRLYRQQIKPTLRAIGIHAVRIDEIHHGENIVNRILREIDQTDCVLVDLTYERPSAYFEAGYSERRSIPVIYTCRVDHLDPPSRESPRVHFDVRQRRIVTWASPTDAIFARRLAAEVRARTAQLRRTQEREHDRQLGEARFQALSLESRCARVMQVGINMARAAGFRASSGKEPWQPGWLGFRQRGGRTDALFLLAVSAYRQRNLIALHKVFGREISEELGGAPSRQCVVVASLSPVPRPRVESVFREFAPDPTLPRSAWTDQSGGILSRLVVLDAIRSERHFQKTFRQVLKRMAGERPLGQEQSRKQ